MILVVILAHSPLATALRQAAESLLGRQKDLLALDLVADDSPEGYQSRLEAGIESCSHEEGVILLADMVGGTPWNVAKRIGQGWDRYGGRALLVAGANLPLIIALVTGRQRTRDIDALAEEAIAAQGEQSAVVRLGGCAV